MIGVEPEEVAGGAPDWIVTFADLMSLLLTFFVLLLSFSTTEVIKFREAMGSIKEALGVKSPNESSTVPSGQNPLTQNVDDIGGAGLSPSELEEQLEQVLKQFGLEAQGEAKQTVYGVVLQLEGDLMFHSGAAELMPETFALLNGLATVVNRVDRNVDVVGHTDNIPIATAVYPSNWELSAARAGQAVRYLVEHGVPSDRLRAIGRAETVPIDTNNTPEGRARNRRVEFVFTAKAGSEIPRGSLESGAVEAGSAQPDPVD
jgi:chemotaxis protein MotB